MNLGHRVVYSRPFRRLVRWSRRIVLPGFQGFSLWYVARLFMRALREGDLPTRAAAISFKLFAAFFPALLMLLTLTPFLPLAFGRGQLLKYLKDVLPPDVQRFLEETVNDLLVRPHAALFSFSFFGSVWLASNSIDAILRGFKGSSNLVAWHRPIKQRLLSIGLLFALTTLLIVALPLLTGGDALIGMLVKREFFGGAVQLFAVRCVRWLVGFGLLLLSVSLLYHAGQPGQKRFRLITPGAVVTVVLVALLSQALALFFRNFTDYNALYGSLGAILAAQLWLYFNMFILLVGHELNVAIGRLGAPLQSRARRGR